MSILSDLQNGAQRLKAEIIALGFSLRHPRTPMGARLLAILIVAYGLSPIDIIPDFVPILGYLDDLILLPLGIYIVLKLIPMDVMEECRKQARSKSFETQSLRRIGLAFIITIWCLSAGAIAYWLF